MFYRKPQEFLPVESAQDLMDLVPLRNVRANRTDGQDGVYAVFEIELRYQKGSKERLAKWLKASDRRRVQVEGVGLQIIEAIDGERRVEQVIDLIMAEHMLSFFEARGVVLYYFKLFTERGLIAVGKEKD
jgi:hypothetical protein